MRVWKYKIGVNWDVVTNASKIGALIVMIVSAIWAYICITQPVTREIVLQNEYLFVRLLGWASLILGLPTLGIIILTLLFALVRPVFVIENVEEGATDK